MAKRERERERESNDVMAKERERDIGIVLSSKIKFAVQYKLTLRAHKRNSV